METAVYNNDTKLLQAYEIVSRLGSGGMADVYKVRHSALGDERAIKVIRADLSTDDRFKQLFLREAKALKRIQHPAIVRCFEFLPDEQHGLWCMIMEMVHGTPLSEMLSQKPLTPFQTLDLLKTLADGLDATHRAGVVHRDLSPDNVILPDGNPKNAKLIDFGIAKIDEFSQETIVGSHFSGKIGFASPEQFGMYGGDVDVRSDIYSLGLVIAAASLGRNLDMGNNAFEAMQKRRSVPKEVLSLPALIRSTVERMLAPDPDHRFESMRKILDFIENKCRDRSSFDEDEALFCEHALPRGVLPEPATFSASRENFYHAGTIEKRRRPNYSVFLLTAVLAITAGILFKDQITNWATENIHFDMEISEPINVLNTLIYPDKTASPVVKFRDRNATPQTIANQRIDYSFEAQLKDIVEAPRRPPVVKTIPSKSRKGLGREPLGKSTAKSKQIKRIKPTESPAKDQKSAGWKVQKAFYSVMDWMFQ